MWGEDCSIVVSSVVKHTIFARLRRSNVRVPNGSVHQAAEQARAVYVSPEWKEPDFPPSAENLNVTRWRHPKDLEDAGKVALPCAA
jgi:hypothetical protein